MRPYILHLCILAVIMIPGVALFTMEALFTQTGGALFRKFDATKIYWLGLIGYSAISTLIVLALNFIYRIKNKQFNKKTTILCHILPIILVSLFIQLGLHDLIQNIWQAKAKEKKNISKQIPKKTDRQRLRVPRAPLEKHLYYQGSERPIGQERQGLRKLKISQKSRIELCSANNKRFKLYSSISICIIGLILPQF